MTGIFEKHKALLAKTRAKLNDAFDRIGDRADEQIYSEGAQWTLRQLAIHLALAGQGHNEMIFRYSQDKEYIPEGYDVDRWNKSAVEKKAEMTLAEARASLEKSRQQLLDWMNTVTDASILEKTGRHPRKESASVSDIIRINALHEEEHARDMLAMLVKTE